MAIALLSVGLLGLLVFLLGLNVSMKRRALTVLPHEAESDPKSPLRKAIRAHGNCTEYVPMLALMILALGLRLPILPWWVAALMIAAVVFRFAHAAAILTGESVYAPSSMKLVGAAGTYLVGLALSIILIYRSALLF